MSPDRLINLVPLCSPWPRPAYHSAPRTTIGATEARPGEGQLTGDHTGAYTLELIPSDFRDVRTYQFMAAWEQAIRPMAGVESLVVFERSAGGPPGRDLDIRLYNAPLEKLKVAALDIRGQLAQIPGTSAIEGNPPLGKQEIAQYRKKESY